MKVLVTGAGGFIGGTLAVRLQETDRVEVIALSRTAAPDGPASGMRWLRCDLTREIPLDEGVDYIIHCAALQEPSDMPVRDFIECNLAMTGQVAAYGRRVGAKGVIFASSLSLHGRIRGGMVDERTGIIDPSPYGISKHLCELVLQECSPHFPTISLRLCGVVGRGAQNIWLARVLSSTFRGEPVEISNADSLFNNVLHTDDLFGFVLNLMKSGFCGFSAFPLASGGPMTVRDVVSGIIASTGSSSEIIDMGEGGTPFLISSEYARRRFGYVPPDVATALTKYVRTQEDCSP